MVLFMLFPFLQCFMYVVVHDKDLESLKGQSLHQQKRDRSLNRHRGNVYFLTVVHVNLFW